MKLPFSISKPFRNEKGMALVMVLLIVTILSVLGIGLLGLSLNNVKLTDVDRKYESAYYIAESGLTLAANEVSNKINSMAEIYDDKDFFDQLHQNSEIVKLSNQEEKELSYSFNKSYGEKPKVIIKMISKQITSNPVEIAGDEFVEEMKIEYTLESTGWIGKQKRTVTELITVMGPIYAANHKGQSDIPDLDEVDENEGGNENDNEPDEDAPGFGNDVSFLSGLPSNMGAFTNGSITLVGGAGIKGNAGTNDLGKNAISLTGGASISGSVYVPEGNESTAVDAPSDLMPKSIIGMPNAVSMNLPAFPAYPSYPLASDTQVQKDGQSYNVIQNGILRVDNWRAADYVLTMADNMAFNEIRLGSNYKMTIDTGNSDKAIVVDRFDVSNGHINIVGSGKLTIYVNEDMNLGAGSTVNQNTSDSNRLSIFLKGRSSEQTVTINGDQKIYGSLFAESADIKMNGSGGFQGHIFTGGSNVDLSGGSRAVSTLIFAPNAEFNMSGGAQINGMVIADSLKGSGGAFINYQPMDFGSIPFIPASPSDDNGNPKDSDDGTPGYPGNGQGEIERGTIRET